METKKTDAEIEKMLTDGVQVLSLRDIEELILAGRYRMALAVSKKILSKPGLREIEKLIDNLAAYELAKLETHLRKMGCKVKSQTSERYKKLNNIK